MRAEQLIARAHRLWDAYYERPTKRNLDAFRRHLTSMSMSKSQNVKREIARGRRAVRRELEGNPIGGKPMETPTALDILGLGMDATESDIEASVRQKQLDYGGRAPSIRGAAPMGAGRLAMLGLVEEAQDVAMDWVSQGRPDLGEWIPVADRPVVMPKTYRDRVFEYFDLEWSEDVSYDDIEAAVRKRWLMIGQIPQKERDEAYGKLATKRAEAESYVWSRERGAELREVVAEATEDAVLAPYRDPRGRLLRKTHKSLKKLGYTTGAQPKRMTDELSAALAEFQADQGLEAHGVLTPQTEDALAAVAGETSLEGLRRSKARERGR